MTFHRLRAATAFIATAALAACALPGVAAAAGEPQITTAGIDAQDRLVATWTLAPGTTFDFVEFSSVPIPDPLLSEFFADDNLAGFECAETYCDGQKTMLTYATSRVSRDRRYFVKVNAVDANDDSLTSAVWEIDVDKPILPGGAGPPADNPTNTPVTGRPYTAPAPGTIPTPTLKIVDPPRKIATVLRRGIRARVTCPVAECFVEIELKLVFDGLLSDDDTIRPGGRRTFVLKPGLGSRQRRRLAGRARARLRIVAEVIQPGGKRTMLSKTLVVTR